MNDILPTNSNLFKKAIRSDFWCVLCRKKEETIKHLLWECKVTKELWSYFLNANFSYLSTDRNMLTNRDYWDWIINNVKTEELAKVMAMVWQIWSYRNTVVFRGENPNLQQLIILILLIERQLQDSHTANTLSSSDQNENPSITEHIRIHEIWFPPSNQYLED